jgi:hypothetical protein
MEASAPSIPPQDLDMILETMLAIQLARSTYQRPMELFVDDIMKELESPGPEQLNLPETERHKFVGRLRSLISLESLMVIAKARELQTEHGHVFLNGRIITDLRPVFRGSPDESPLGMVLLHILKLSYLDRESEGKRSAFFIALDESDIAALKRLLERAETKASTLRSKLEAAGISCLGEARKA